MDRSSEDTHEDTHRGGTDCVMTFCMPIDFVYKCANVCRVSKGQEKVRKNYFS